MNYEIQIKKKTFKLHILQVNVFFYTLYFPFCRSSNKTHSFPSIIVDTLYSK